MKIGKDKFMHFGVCTIATLIHPLLAAGLAIGKEYGDSKAYGNHWDWYDILADALGIALGMAIRYSFNILF
jgi:uncharacterized protein YfiM (DUF2279 family)